jgi:hypothetical protein
MYQIVQQHRSCEHASEDPLSRLLATRNEDGSQMTIEN